MNHAKNGTIKTSIKNSIFELIFIGFHALYPPSLHSNVDIYIMVKLTKNEDVPTK